MNTTIDICHQPLEVFFDYRITYSGHKPDETDPGAPMEFTISNIYVADENNKPLPTPDWLATLIAEELMESDAVYEKIVEENS